MRAAALALCCLAATWSCADAPTAPASTGTDRAEPTTPNVLLLSLDSTRYDVLGYAGARWAGHSPSPHIDRLAREGVAFENAQASTSWTLPSHATILTGELELVHGLELTDFTLSPSVSTLAERLARAGYRTVGFYSGPYLEPGFGLGRGCATYEACYGAAFSSGSTHSGSRSGPSWSDFTDPRALDLLGAFRSDHIELLGRRGGAQVADEQPANATQGMLRALG